MKMKWEKVAIFCLSALLFVTGLWFYPVSFIQADTAGDIQSNIDNLEKKLKDALAKKDKLEDRLSNINYSVVQTQKDIHLAQQIIQQVESEISRSEKELEAQNQKMDAQRQILAGLLQEIYYDQRESMPFIMLAENNLASIFSKSDNLTTLQGKINDLIDQIKGMQAVTLQTKSNLETSQQQKERLLSIKQQQKQSLLGDKAETQGNIEDAAAIIDRLNKELDQLRSDLATVTGQSYNAKDIKDAVEFASKKTGVPKGFLVGVLKVETNLGANVGKGTYKADMNPNQRSTFESICKALGYNPGKKPVSRRICYNPKAKDHCGGWGGAMGVAQFIPTTWMAYASRASSITGHSPADPWNLTDGVMAMALKLARTPGVTSGKTSAYKQAACSYLGACNTSYINSVLYWASNYDKLL